MFHVYRCIAILMPIVWLLSKVTYILQDNGDMYKTRWNLWRQLHYKFTAEWTVKNVENRSAIIGEVTGTIFSHSADC